MRVSSASAAQVVFLANLRKCSLAVVLGELLGREHPPADVVDAEPVHSVERFIALPRLQVSTRPFREQRHALQIAPCQVADAGSRLVVLDALFDVFGFSHVESRRSFVVDGLENIHARKARVVVFAWKSLAVNIALIWLLVVIRKGATPLWKSQ